MTRKHHRIRTIASNAKHELLIDVATVLGDAKGLDSVTGLVLTSIDDIGTMTGNNGVDHGRHVDYTQHAFVSGGETSHVGEGR